MTQQKGKNVTAESRALNKRSSIKVYNILVVQKQAYIMEAMVF